MGRTIGVLATNRIAAGLVENGQLAGPLRLYPESTSAVYVLDGMSAESIGESILRLVELIRADLGLDAVGVAVPGIVREGVVEDSPNLPQVKGFRLQENLEQALRERCGAVPVRVFNDADVIAAGLAAARGCLGKLVRVWNLGHGVGYGRSPWQEGIWEGGHCVVTLDPREHFCGCGGRGHLEGIMGTRAMRLRFLDKEPEEIFAGAKAGDSRCVEFVKVWHRALAAATATCISMEGPGKFFITGSNAQFIEIGRLSIYLHEMVKMSPLQGSQFEAVSTGIETGVVGAAVNAEIAIRGTP
ncbi:MAG: ROK family protein [Terriglobia bacterium]